MSEVNLIMRAMCVTALCSRQIADRSGVKIPMDIMAEIIHSDPDLEHDLEGYNTCSESLDTFTRDYLMDAVANYFTGDSWPCWMDGEDVFRNFMEQLQIEATKRGCEILSREEESSNIVHGGKVLV